MYDIKANGDTLDAAHVNGLLWQTIIKVPSSSRPPSPTVGMMIYEEDTRLYRAWSGTQWEVQGGVGSFSYTPTLTAVGGSLNMGTGASRKGQYTRSGNSNVLYTFEFVWGSSMNAGSGILQIDLPVPADPSFGGVSPAFWGSGRVDDVSAGTGFQATTYIPGANLSGLYIVANNIVATNAGPITWAVGDKISGSITYKAAAGS